MNFWTKLTRKGYFRSKQHGNQHWILHIWIHLGSKLQFNKEFWVTEQISKKRILPVENRKNKHHHWILHIRVSFCTNFQLRVTHRKWGGNTYSGKRKLLFKIKKGKLKPGKWLPQHLYQKINNIVGSMLERTPNNNFWK